MDELGKVFFDILKMCVWSAGVMFRQFELGREGRLPELVSKGGQDAIQDIKEKEIKRPKEKPDKRFPMGFA